MCTVSCHAHSPSKRGKPWPLKTGCLYSGPNRGECHNGPEVHTLLVLGAACCSSRGWPRGRQHQHHWLCSKGKFADPLQTEPETLGVDAAVCVVTRPPGDSDAHPILRTYAQSIPCCEHIQEPSRQSQNALKIESVP